MFTGNETLDKSIQRLIERWEDLARLAGPTSEDLGEQAIKQFYQILKKTPPRQIVWCDSPCQMVALPVLLANVVQEITWSEAVARMSVHPSGSAQWEDQWQKQWARILERHVLPLLPTLFPADEFMHIEKIVVDATVSNLQSALRQAVIGGSLEPGSMVSSSSKKNPLNSLPLASFLDLEFLQSQYTIRGKVERLAGVKMDGSVDPLSSFTERFNQRWLSRLIPAAEPFLGVKHPPEVCAAIERVRARCEALNERFAQMLNWMLRLPVRRPVAAPAVALDPEKPLMTQVLLALAVVSSQEQHREAHAMNAAHIVHAGFISWLPYAAGWLPFALACKLIDPRLFKDLDEEIDCWAYLAHAACGYFFTGNVAFACRRPIMCRINANGMPHNDGGPAMVWRDSYSVYAWKGIPVENDLIEKRNELTFDRISSEQNVEIRRVMIDIYGDAKYLQDAGAKMIHEDECGQLYQLDIRGDEPIMMAKVRNSTPEPDGTYKFYFLRVPPSMTSARQAVAWSFQMTAAEYNPQVES